MRETPLRHASAATARGVLLWFAAIQTSAAVAQSFLPLPFSTAYGVSADGKVVAGNDTQALRWTAAGGILHLGASSAEGISADGLVIVGAGFLAFGGMRWTEAAGVTSLGTADKALAASSDGAVIVGGATFAPGVSAFRWTTGTGALPLGFLPGTNASRALATNADGSVVVGDGALFSAGVQQSQEAYRWTQGSGMVGIGRLAGDTHSIAQGVNCRTV